MSKKKKFRKRRRKFDPSRQDFHHFLWMKRTWSKGWQKRLREHPYCGAYLPQMTLHRFIHLKVKSVPMPDQKHCKTAYIALESWLEAGLISLDDPPTKKLEFVAKCFRAECPGTAKALDVQKQIVVEFEKRP